ncbi:hypothetical protein DSL64_04795 [Dyadobacter luteus]|uniref:ATPase AAA-type core domain-containing protein n=1 Tax=Dyadobacter luteus TaxID=2259619 RepID=A0A3D8YIY5_9BACT|nr:AAA family ATPase [Dyadobacter luteus]REA63750.1 hypothetical protein DSL64_04795 [Dyadobacter luteus]
MNAKSLPLQVTKELKEISQFLKEAIEKSHLNLDLSPRDNFGFKVSYRKSEDLEFSIISHRIFQGKPLYSANIVPLDPTTSVNDSKEEFTEMYKDRIMVEFNQWLALLTDYEDLSHVNLKDLFKLEQDEQFLQNEPDTFSEKSDILHYCLKSLSVSNFQGIKRATIENLPVDTRWVFLVGENGFGKSTILQSIVLGLHGTKDGSYDYAPDSNSRIKVEYKSETQNLINDFKINPSPLAHLAAYGPVRLNMQVDASTTDAAQKNGTLYSLFRTDGVLRNIESELVIWSLKNDNRFKLVRKAFLRLVPNLSDVRFNSTSNRIEYIEKDIQDDEQQFEPLPFGKIASGFRSILGMAGDMIVRLSESQKEVTDPTKLKGIVIIDELDLHWHPKLQKQIPELFGEVFPGIQFIVSTHSPIPLLGAPKNSVILKVNRTKEEGITIQRVEIDLKSLTPNLLLTSGIFDMDDIFSSQSADITAVRTEETFSEMIKNDQVDNYLKDFEQSNQQFPDELFEAKSK